MSSNLLFSVFWFLSICPFVLWPLLSSDLTRTSCPSTLLCPLVLRPQPDLLSSDLILTSCPPTSLWHPVLRPYPDLLSSDLTLASCPPIFLLRPHPDLLSSSDLTLTSVLWHPFSGLSPLNRDLVRLLFIPFLCRCFKKEICLHA